MSRVYCSDAARLRGDENTATAARIDVWILVEFPGTWGHDPIRDAALPPPVAAALRRAVKEIPRSRLVFIRRRETYSRCRVYLVRSAPEIHQQMLDLPSIDDVAQVPFERLSRQVAGGSPQEAAERPLMLVCTHGQHDSCCGRRGYPLYDVLRQRQELDVWQCSHIGGDRFAANAVVLPRGLYYGPVEVREADALTQSALRDEVYLSAYRGRSSFTRVEQAAETFLRRETGLLANDAVHIIGREALGAERTRVHLATRDGHEYDVTLEQYATDEALLTCTSGSALPIPQFRRIDLQRRDPEVVGSER
ncbi:MAG: sucrase ferredoxin [Acidobacteriota bacterium]